MRVGSPMMTPLAYRAPVRAGGGPSLNPQPALETAPATAPVSSPATTPPPANSGLGGALVKAEGFFSNLWDTLIAPLFKNLLGMFGLNV